MSKQKVVQSTIRLVINAGQAKPSPPVGPALGQAGLKIMDFCKDFNAKTADVKVGRAGEACKPPCAAGQGGAGSRPPRRGDPPITWSCAPESHLQDDVPIPVIITAYQDKTFTYVMKTPPASYFLKKAAGVAAGSGKPGHQNVACISLKHIYEIALVKRKDLPHTPLESICQSLIGSCKSMGLKVVAQPEDAA